MCECVCVHMQQGSGKGEAWRSGLEEMLGSSAPASRLQHRTSSLSADPKVGTLCILCVASGFPSQFVTSFGTISIKRIILSWPHSACKEQEV